ncbi:MAG: aspartate aminotransferase family protein, partial [Alteromonadaceae bacterium]
MLNPERSKLLNLLDLNKDIASAKGAWLTSTCGEVYLDFTSQYGAVPFGFNPDFLQQQLIEQVNTNAAVMVQPFFSQGAKELSDLLIEIAPEGLKYVTFACTGAEVVEAAIKLAKSGTNRKKILSTLNSFHGKTMGAALATGNAYYKEEFYSDNASFLHIPYDDLEALELALSGRKIAAFIVEPVQGEGGMIEPSPGYLQGCQALCAHYNTLFVVDEIQTGLGRTGELFVSLKEGITPDILLVGKALGGGMLPISACIANEKAWSTDFGLRHSSTFANNHLAAHMGIGTIKALREQHEILENVNNMGHYLREQLEKLVARYPEVYTGCSGRGLMQGLMLSPWRDPQSYVPCCVYEFGYAVAIVSSYLLNQNHILTVPTLNANNVLRIQPNYFVEQGMIDRFIEALNEVAEIIKQGQFVRLLRNAIGLTAPMPNQDLPPLRLPRQAPPEPTQDEPYRGRFAFFIHPTTEEEGVDGLCAEISQFSPEERERARTWMNECSSLSPIAVPAYHIPCFASDDGGYIDGWLIASFLSPRDMMRLNKAEKTKLLTGYIEQAKALGVDRIGLGAFTSVISRSGTLVADSGVDVTTGNSYTALTSTDAVRQIVHHSGRSLSTMQLGVVGALGSVGRLCLLDLAGECASINLIGNARNKDRLSTLKSLAGEMLLSLVNADKPNAIPILMRL